jgi:Raf kinase inhibitor-like YbhB/YbcL family protein
MPKMHLGALKITSPDFAAEERIPDLHTSIGDGTAPELHFEGVPDSARSLALVCHDPDAPMTHGFDHWVVYDLPPDVGTLAASPQKQATEGVNSAGDLGYTGPAPPPGHGVHHYFFHLYALDAALNAQGGLTRAELLELIDDHILEQARLVGTFSTESS